MSGMFWLGLWCIALGLFGVLGRVRRWPVISTDRFTRWLQRVGVVRDEAYYQRLSIVIIAGVIALGIVLLAVSIRTGG